MSKDDSGNKGMVFMGMGFELMILLLGGAYFGKIIDKRFGWPGYGTLTLILIFFVSWFYHLLILLKQVNRDDSSDGS